MELQSRYLTWLSDSPTTVGWSILLLVWPQAGRLSGSWKARNAKVGCWFGFWFFFLEQKKRSRSALTASFTCGSFTRRGGGGGMEEAEHWKIWYFRGEGTSKSCLSLTSASCNCITNTQKLDVSDKYVTWDTGSNYLHWALALMS